MSVGVIVELAGLAIALAVGIASVYVIFEMRTVYSDHQDKFVRVVTAVESFQKRLESDTHALQDVATQIENMVAELSRAVPSAVLGSADRHAAAIADLRDHLDHQESKLVEIAQNLADDVRTFQETRRLLEHANGDGEYVRLSRNILANDPRLRFSLVKDWVALNKMAIARRAARPWNTPKQLIIGIPESIEAEAEVLEDGVLIIGTRGHAEKITIPLKDCGF